MNLGLVSRLFYLTVVIGILFVAGNVLKDIN